MRPHDEQEAERLRGALDAYESQVATLPGITTAETRQSFLEQLVESERRVRYVRYFVGTRISPTRTDPSSGEFDPLKAAILHHRGGDFEEACWMLFLFIHFGKHRKARWTYSAGVYGGLDGGQTWTWPRVSHDVAAFRNWLEQNQGKLRDPSRPHGFGNHRKYESLGGWSKNGTGAVVDSYVEWVKTRETHLAHFQRATREAGDNQHDAFNLLFQSMRAVHRFGRTARFDYLSMAGKLDLASIRPGHAYLVGSTGPLRGARLLFDTRKSEDSTAHALDARIVVLESYLRVGFDPLEDALCNWQKSPGLFKPFRG